MENKNDNSEILLKSAISQITTNPQNALQNFQQILTENPQQPDALHGIGVLLSNDKQFSKAAEYLAKAISALQNQQILTPKFCQILSAWLQELAICEIQLLNAKIIENADETTLYQQKQQIAFHLMQSKIFSQTLFFNNFFHENFDFLFEKPDRFDDFWKKYSTDFAGNFTAIKFWLNNAENLYENTQRLAEPFSCAVLVLFLNSHTPPHSNSENINTTLYKRIFADCAYTFLAYLVINSADKNKTEITKNYLNLVENLQNLQNFSENEDFFKHFQAMYFRLQAVISENTNKNQNQKLKKSFIENAENAEKHYKNSLTLAQIFANENNFAKAEDLCNQAENLAKNHIEKSAVLCVRAKISLQQNKINEAKNLSEEAIKLFGKNKAAWIILRDVSGIANLGKSAAFVCENILKIDPFDESAYINLGERLRRNYQTQQSLKFTQMGLAFYPESPNLWANLGTTLHGDGKFEMAKLAYQKALGFKPEFAEVANNLGVMAIAEKSWLEALKYFEIALKSSPSGTLAHTDMLQNKASALVELEAKPEQITEVAEQIRKVNPRSENADLVYAKFYNKTGDYYKSLEYYKKALQLNPNSAGIHYSVGSTLKELHQFTEAEKYYRKSLEINPDNYGAVSGLLFTSHYFEYRTPQELFELAKHYGELVQNHTDFVYDKWNIPQNKDFPRENENFLQQNPPKIKVGFTSGDFKNHPVGYFLEAVMQYLKSSNKLELFAYTTQNKEDDLTARIKPSFDHWIQVYGKSARMIAQQIHNDGIQILVDLSGHTGYNALTSFAYKPAPIQCSWLGYFATTGLKAVDYVIGDPFVAPKEENNQFVEKIWYMPKCYYHFTPPPDYKTHPSLQVGEMPCLKNGYMTFGSFNNLSKVNDAVVELWAKVLNAVPNSKLFLKYKQLGDENIRQSICERFGKFGIAAERLRLEGNSPRYDLLNCYNSVDIALDTFPYTGGTTSAESIFMGVPVLVKHGDRFLSHISETAIINAGYADFVAKDAEDYVKKAVFFSQPEQITKLNERRQNFRATMEQNILFNDKNFAEDVVEMFCKMWRHFVNKNNSTEQQ